jgi:hypothetical protein
MIFIVGCQNQKDNNDDTLVDDVKILLLNTYGERIKTESLGLNTEYLTIYVSDPTIDITNVLFTTKTNLTFEQNHLQSEEVTNLGKFFHVGYDNPDFSYFEISRIEISTSIGTYTLDTSISTMIESDDTKPINIDVIDIDIYDLVFLDDTLNDDFKFSIDLNLLSDNVIIKNIELLNNNLYPESLMINNVFINGVAFESGNDDFTYNEGVINLRIALTDYYLGHYAFRVTYQYDGQTFQATTSAMSVILSVDENKLQDEAFNQRLQTYINGNLANEFEKKN